MVGTIELFGSTSINNEVVRIALAVALGLFLGLEREWSQKEAGIRTFALISVLGTIFTLYDGVQCSRTAASQITLCIPFLSAMGGFFVIIVAGILMYSGLATEEEGLHLTTAVSMLVAYGVGVLVAVGHVLSATVVTVTSSVLLVFKRELHGLAWGLSREEIRSASEFAILAFVIYPLLPADSVTIGSERLSITLEPRVVWLMVVFVAAIGIVNYAIVKTYDSRGIAVTGFFGGLASSTAVVGTMLDHVRQNPQTATYGVAAILLADAAMALRNLVIALVFTLSGKLLLGTVLPLGVIVLVSIVVAAWIADWKETVEMDLDTPFSMRNALGFGALFLLVVIAGGIAQAQFGQFGFFVTAFITGLVSSAGATTSAVVLYRTNSLSHETAVIAILLATAASIAIKAALVFSSDNRKFVRDVVIWSSVLLVVGAVANALSILA